MAARTFVLWNPNASRVAEADRIRQELQTLPDFEVFDSSSSAEGMARVRAACEQGVERVVAAGGDGTINCVVNGMAAAGCDAVLGVLPLGTANDWCASLGIPDDLSLALELLHRSPTRRLDLVELETRSRAMRYANIATGGNSHRVTEAITSEQKQTWGAMCYVVSGLSILGDLRSIETEICWDDDTTERYSVWNLIVANGRTSAGRLAVAPRALLDDGLLDVVIIEEGSLLDIAKLTTSYVFDEFIHTAGVTYRQARQIRIRSEPTIKFSIDGDMVDEEPISFRVVPQAVEVIVGEDAAVTDSGYVG